MATSRVSAEHQQRLPERALGELMPRQQSHVFLAASQQGRISAIPSADFRARPTAASLGGDSRRITAMPTGVSAYMAARDGSPARSAAAHRYWAALRSLAESSAGLEYLARGSRPEGARILGVYTAEEWARKNEPASETAGSATSALPSRLNTSVASDRWALAEQTLPMKVTLHADGNAREGGAASGSQGVPTDLKNAVSAYRDLDALISDIRKEMELNKAEEEKTKMIKEQMHRKRGVALENRQAPETLAYTPSALDDLGRKNASLLSQMRAATAAVSSASTVGHSSATSTVASSSISDDSQITKTHTQTHQQLSNDTRRLDSSLDASLSTRHSFNSAGESMDAGSLKSLAVPRATKTSTVSDQRSSAAADSAGQGNIGQSSERGSVAEDRIRDAEGLLALVTEASPSSASTAEQDKNNLTPDGSMVRNKAPTASVHTQLAVLSEGVAQVGEDQEDEAADTGTLRKKQPAATRAVRSTAGKESEGAHQGRTLPQEDVEDGSQRAAMQEPSANFPARHKAFPASSSNSFADAVPDVNAKPHGHESQSQRLHSALNTNAQAQSQAALPPGWEMKLDTPSGKIFYVNHTIRAITWERPTQGIKVAGAPEYGVRRGQVKAGAMYSNTSFADNANGRRPTSRSASAQSPSSPQSPLRQMPRRKRPLTFSTVQRPGHGQYSREFSMESGNPPLSSSFDPTPYGARRPRDVSNTGANSEVFGVQQRRGEGPQGAMRGSMALDSSNQDLPPTHYEAMGYTPRTEISAGPQAQNIPRMGRSAGPQLPNTPRTGRSAGAQMQLNRDINFSFSAQEESDFDFAPPATRQSSQSVHASAAQRRQQWQQPPPGRADSGGNGAGTRPLFDFSISQLANAQDTDRGGLLRSSSSQLRNSFDFSNAPEEGYGNMLVGDSDDMVKIRRNSLNTQMGFRRNSVNTQILPGRQHPGGSNTSKTDQKTTKLLVAVSDKLWQCVLQGQQPAIIAHSVEFEDVGSRPAMLDLYDYDRFVKNMYKITDGGDESPTKAPEDEAIQYAHEPPAVQEALTWQV